MFLPRGDEVTGGWRKKLHDEKLHNFYSSPDIIRNDRIKGNEMDREFSMHGREYIKMLVEVLRERDL
jgi:hypothetical protein